MNIFDLKKIGGISSSEPYVKPDFNSPSDSERKKLLQNYERVGSDELGSLENGTHIRYEKKDGSFMRGGFIVNNYISAKDKTKGDRMLRLSSSIAPDGKEWTINATRNVDSIWRTTKFKPQTSPSEVTCGLQQTTQNLSTQLEQMRIEISRISNEQKRIIALIKKLHNINI